MLHISWSPRAARLGIFAGLSLCLSVFPLCAQDAMPIVPLTEKIVIQTIPVIKAKIEATKAARAKQTEIGDASADIITATFTPLGAIKSGADPLATCKKMSDQCVYPDKLRYYPKTSVVYGEGVFKASAVFSYGIRSPAKIEAALKMHFTDKAHWEAALGAAKMDQTTAERKPFLDFFNATHDFYTARHFKEVIDHGLIFWFSPDGLVSVQMIECNELWMPKPDTGELMPTGPILLVSVGVKNESSVGPAADPFTPALKNAGLKVEDFDLYFYAILTAAGDSKNEAALDTSPFPEAPADMKGKELADYNKAKEEYEKNAGIAVRKANLVIYKDHAAELDPLVDEYQQLLR